MKGLLGDAIHVQQTVSAHFLCLLICLDYDLGGSFFGLIDDLLAVLFSLLLAFLESFSMQTRRLSFGCLQSLFSGFASSRDLPCNLSFGTPDLFNG